MAFPLLPAAVFLMAGPQSAPPAELPALLTALRGDLDLHRRLVVAFAGEAGLQGAARERALAEGHALHHQRRTLVFHLDRALGALAQEEPARREQVAGALLDWMERDPDLLDLDRLAFRDPLRVLQKALASDRTPAGAALKARVARDLAEVDRVEARVEAEYRRVFGGAGQAPAGGGRDLWDAYVQALVRKTGAALPPAAEAPRTGPHGEITGRDFPPKVLVLTFDDGPHHVYTPEIQAILRARRIPAVFFEVGRNLGTVDAAGKPHPGPLAALSEGLVRDGFVIGNHSFTHAQLSKETGAPLEAEIEETDALLGAIPGARSHLFRFPYGARAEAQLKALEPHGLRSVLWNIDSLDWADPVPASVSGRVLRLVREEKRGIILFHDIHDRALKVLPGLLDGLRAQGYRFAGLDAQGNLVER